MSWGWIAFGIMAAIAVAGIIFYVAMMWQFTFRG